jgi:hypothetical protein
MGSAVVPTAVVGVSPTTSPFFHFQPERGARRTPQRPGDRNNIRAARFAGWSPSPCIKGCENKWKYRENQRLTRAICGSVRSSFSKARPHPNLLPQEKERLWTLLVLAMSVWPWQPQVFESQPTIHPLLEERAAPQAVHPICCSVLGVRTSAGNDLIFIQVKVRPHPNLLPQE